jgi:hypothetical protein
MNLSDVVFECDYSQPEAEEIMRCIRNLVLTPKGTCPLNRDFGISTDSTLDCPLEAAEAMLAVEIMEQIDKYEPRVRATQVTFEYVEDSLIAKVVLEYV